MRSLRGCTRRSSRSPSRPENPRSGNRPFLDRLLDFDVAVAGAFRLHVPDRREALLQCPANGVGGARRPQRNSRIQDVRVIAALCRVLAPQEDVRVRIDQSRQHGGVRKIDDLRFRGNRGRAIRHFLDSLPSHEDELVRLRRCAHAVDQVPRPDHGQRRCDGASLSACPRALNVSNDAPPQPARNDHSQVILFIDPSPVSHRNLRQSPWACNTGADVSAFPTVDFRGF